MKTFPVDPITRTRRNHAFEHASMQLLARRAPGVRMAGYSTPGGFFIIGQVHISDVQEAVNEALARLQKGESGLAIHPYCGTNFVVSGIAAGLAAWLAMLGGDKVDLVLSDMAPNKSGMDAVDQPRAMHLSELAMEFADGQLRAGGTFLIKLFQGVGFDDYVRELRRRYAKVVIRKPAASRNRSPEVYALATGKLAQMK